MPLEIEQTTDDDFFTDLVDLADDPEADEGEAQDASADGSAPESTAADNAAELLFGDLDFTDDEMADLDLDMEDEPEDVEDDEAEGEAEATEGDEQPEDVEGGEAEGEAQDEGEGDQPALDVSEDALRHVSNVLGTHLASGEQLVDHIEQLVTERDASAEWKGLLAEDQALRAIVAARLEGRPIREAVVEHVDGIQDQVPDPDLDPQGYREYVEKQAAEKARREQMTAEQERQQEQIEKIKKATQRQFKAFVEREGMVNDEGEPTDEARQLAQEFVLFTQGDPTTGHVHPRMFDLFYKAKRHDQLIEQAREDAYEKGVKEGIQKVKNARRGGGDTIPLLSGGGDASAARQANTKGEDLMGGAAYTTGDQIAKQF